MITMMKGLPASGKSTWAINQAKSTGAVRVNKDQLRDMLFGVGNWSQKNELFVLQVRDLIITQALERDKDVIVDDTNLAPKHLIRLTELANKYKTDIGIKDFTDVPVEECIKRDKHRQQYVGEKVIMQMYKQYLAKPIEPPETLPGKPTAIICDLDGTLCLLNGRSPYDTAKCLTDKINPIVADLIKNAYIDYGTQLILCSGREDKFRLQTEQWLHENGVEYHHLFMRPTDDFRKDSVIKQEIYDGQIKGNFNIKYVLDDRNQVVDMWRSNGLTVLQVADGDF